MQFKQAILSIYYRVPSVSADYLYKILGLPQTMVRAERARLVEDGCLEKDANKNYNITPKGLELLNQIDREKAADELAFIRHRTEVVRIALNADISDIHSVSPLSRGMTNDSYIFSCKDKKYIFRKAGAGSEKLVDREREYNTYKALQGKGISDVVVYHSAKDGIKITEYIENTRACDPGSKRDRKAALDAIRKLHTSDISSPHDFSFIEMNEHYENLCRNRGAEFFKAYTEYKPRVYSLLGDCEKMHPAKVFCHIDFVPDNCLIKPDGTVTLIDWEYSGARDELVDIAMFCHSAGFTKRECDRFLKEYLERTPTDEEYYRLYTYISAAGMLWSLWSEYKASTGQKFTGYTQRALGYCERFAKYAQEIKERGK